MMTNQELRAALDTANLDDDDQAAAFLLEFALSTHEVLERIADEIELTRIVLRDVVR